MNNNDKTERNYEIELLKLVEEFKTKFRAGTRDSENFMTLSEIEEMWSKLRLSTSDLYSDLITDELSKINEADLISKKKQNIEKKE